jgi:hypothetical protein
MHPVLLLAAGQLFFVEAQPSVVVGDESAVGNALAVEAGVGGSIASSRPRFFLVGRYETAGLVYESPPSRLGYRLERDWDDASLGLRILVPIVEPVRIYADALVGTTLERGELRRIDLPALASERQRLLWQLALGLQVRLHTHFSIGARVQETWLPAEVDTLAVAAGASIDPARTSFALTVGAHF